MNHKVFRDIVKLIAIFAVLLLAVYKADFIVRLAATIMQALSPVFLGIVIAFVLYRPYKFFKRLLCKVIPRQKVAKLLAVAITYLLFFAVFTTVLGIVVPQTVESLSGIAASANIYQDNLANILSDFGDSLTGLGLTAQDISNMVGSVPNLMSEYLPLIMPNLFNITSGVISAMATLLLGLFLSVYLLLDANRLQRAAERILDIYLPSAMAHKVRHVAAIVNETFSSFIVGQLTEGLIFGSLTFAGMLILQLDYPMLIGVICGVASLIPTVGYFLGLIPSALILLLVNPNQAIIFIVFYVILQQIENNVIYPRIVGDSVGLPALWVLVAVIIFGGLFGLLGTLIGIPTFSVFYKLFKEDMQARAEQRQSLTE